MTIEQLRGIIDDPQTTPENRAIAQNMLDAEEQRLASVGGARVQNAVGSGDTMSELAAIIAGLETALKGGSGGGTVNLAMLRQAVNDELEKRKISLQDLSPDLLAFLNAKRQVTFTMKMMNISRSTNASPAFLERTLTQLILSDVLARNNVYLFGGAGTGKTFIAEAIGNLLGWEVITLNCNQFTSPLDILGGQTIDGYQEGKLSMAWNNEIVNPDGSRRPISGAVLLLDELPKIDPNTAGILNDALAKVKSFRYDNGKVIPPTIRNGRNEVLTLGNLFVIATGNVALNTIDPDYEANFKQDLSLQDRFIGSTYEVFVDYDVEWKNIGKGFAFIWLFLVKVREKIKELRANGQAFVSLRLMINVVETYKTYREVLNRNARTAGTMSSDAVTRPKTVIDSMNTFFDLFKEATRTALLNEVNYNDFKRIVAEKDAMPYNPDDPNFDNPQEISEAERLIALNKQMIENKYN